MTKRPLVIFGAAFLITVTAALFAPWMLLLAALPLAFCVACGLRGRAVIAAFLGCLGALACCLPFAAGAGRAQALVGSTVQLRGFVLYDGGRQLLVSALPDGHRVVLAPFPPLEDVQTGDGIACTAHLQGWAYSSRLLSGGMELSGMVEKQAPLEKDSLSIPFAVWAAQLRKQLSATLTRLVPSSATAVTNAVLLSDKSSLDPAVRQAFRDSGMAHILAASGLHLSILVGCIAGVAGKLPGGRLLRAVVGTVCAAGMFFATGMPVSMLRAAVMAVMGFAAQLFSRRSDGLTSLAVAAVLIVALCPPAVADLSFQLSFLAVLGVLLLSPRLSLWMETQHTARFGHCSKFFHALYAALSVSASAQLFTAPVVALQFGAVPLLAIPVNLVAIPMVYPVLLLGQLCSAAAALGLAPVAKLLLGFTNLFSRLLTGLATLTASLPFAGMRVVFPLDWLPLMVVGLFCVLLCLLPSGSRTLRRTGAACAAAFVLLAALNSWLWSHTAVVAASSQTGTLFVATPHGSVVTQSPDNRYLRELDQATQGRLGDERLPLVLPVYTGGTPFTPMDGVTVSYPSPYTTELFVFGTKIMKYDAVYDTIIKHGGQIPADAALIADLDNNLLSPGAAYRVLRRADGMSYVRIPATMRRDDKKDHEGVSADAAQG